jgi:hypothetical protein
VVVRSGGGWLTAGDWESRGRKVFVALSSFLERVSK